VCPRRAAAHTHLVLIDESVFSLSTAQAANRISGINPQAVTLTLQREFSMQSLITGVTYDGMDPLVVRNCAMIILLPGLLDAQRAGHQLGLPPATIALLQTELPKETPSSRSRCSHGATAKLWTGTYDGKPHASSGSTRCR
jgi:hypothetical protein